MSDYNTNLKYSSLTQNKRKEIKVGMDEFCTFSWCDLDAWEEFGVFIINDKNDLKFYNGPQFSNTYAQPQYNTSALLEGVSFKTQQIKFKIGVYWIGDEDYRRFINWLNPYAIGTLIFSFNEKWGYTVKLANREDSTRYVVGYELEDDGSGNRVSKRRYYTEMNLTFEVQGEPCAVATTAYEFNKAKITNGYEFTLKDIPYTISNLPFPFKVTFAFTYNTANIQNDGLHLIIKYDNLEPVELFTLYWDKEFISNTYVTTTQTQDIIDEEVVSEQIPTKTIWLEYDSESGIIYQKYGDGQYKLLNLWSSTEEGIKVLQTIMVKKFLIPGTFNNPDIDMTKVTLQLVGVDFLEEGLISMNARTNVI